MSSRFDTLRQIHRKHSYGWPFETFDVFLSGTNDLSPESLARKLTSQRGGWCFELNEWLALALEKEAFPLRRLMARNVYASDRPRTHQICLVEAEGELWTADAGFGAQTPREPMKLEDGYEGIQDGLPYRTVAVGAEPGPLGEPEAWIIQSRHQGQWKGLYRFTLESAPPADFEVGNHFHLTSPTSTFADVRVATKPIPGGRITLADHVLKTYTTGADGEVLVAEESMASRLAYGKVLEEEFGIVLSGPAIDRLWNLEPSVSRGSLPLVTLDKSRPKA